MNNTNNKNKFILDTGATAHFYPEPEPEPEPTPEPTRVRITAGGNLIAPGDHRVITAERAIQTLKNQFYTPVVSAAYTQVSYTPVVYSLEFRQAWKTIVDENRNKPKNKRKRQRKH